ncbi:MAG: hypothetical protein P4L22_07205 [Candidatus Babeliales bacterium]|nr:hypothetical protein [Candidatus Babeliales bacterium]
MKKIVFTLILLVFNVVSVLNGSECGNCPNCLAKKAFIAAQEQQASQQRNTFQLVPKKMTAEQINAQVVAWERHKAIESGQPFDERQVIVGYKSKNPMPLSALSHLKYEEIKNVTYQQLNEGSITTEYYNNIISRAKARYIDPFYKKHQVGTLSSGKPKFKNIRINPTPEHAQSLIQELNQSVIPNNAQASSFAAAASYTKQEENKEQEDLMEQ